MIPILLLLLTINTSFIGNIQVDVNMLDIQQNMEYTKIRILGYEISNEVGAPEVPVRAMKVALPYGVKVTDIEIISSEYQDLHGEFLLSYVQPPFILSQDEIKTFVEPNEAIYSSNMPYPENILVFKGAHPYDNHQICELLFYPVQYLPESGKVRYIKSLAFAINYEGGVKMRARGSRLKKMVINPEDVITDTDQERNNFKYLIISNTPIDTVFQRLADWKTKKGIKAEIRTLTWIVNHYSGEDNAARIRNYLKTLPDSSVEYVLLGGDTGIIPCRFAYAMSCSAGIYPGREDTMPADLYFADLQGNWDFDNDGSYGEIEDSIDLYPDLYVGRATVSSVEEAQTFVNKVLTYEKNPTLDYLDNVLLAGDVMWDDPYTDGGIHKDMIEQESFSPNFEVTKLYYSQGTLNRVNFLNAVGQGQNLINHDGHGWYTTFSVGHYSGEYIYRNDLYNLTNGPRYGIMISIGCWTAAFDFNSIGNVWLKSTNGAGVAYIGNSSYGWGSPGNPGYGYSDRFDSRFFYALLKENNFHLGEAVSLCKAYYIPYSREKNVYRWHQYELNLLGDPEMPVWSDTPETLTVSYPQSIPLGTSRILVTVKNKNSNEPIKEALVCLMKGTESYASGYTDASGSVFLNATPSSAGNFDLTVTAQNHLPLETTIPTVSGAYVNYLGWILDDASGNSDGIANPGEDIYLDVMLKNNGNATSNNIQLKLRSSDSYVTIQDSSASLSSLNVDDSVMIDNAFDISIGSASNGHGITFELEITDAARTLIYNPIILVGTPVFSFEELVIENPPAMPGDTESVSLKVVNSGYGYAHAPVLTLSCSDPYITILTDSINVSDIPPESSQVFGPFNLHISSSIPQGHHPLLSFNIVAETYSHNEDINLIVGQTGFWDDMESGSGLWTTGGTNNLWHISTRRSLSPSHSWYCGNEASGQYVNNMDCYIQTIPFMIAANSLLKFYRWFQVPLYGADGIYVIIMGNGFADTLDFIGTGGALKKRDIQSDWFAEKYSLAEYPAGDTIQVRIAFISDNDGDIGEGFYIDNFNVDYVTMIEEFTPDRFDYTLLELCPNPFRDKIDIQFNPGNVGKDIEIKIYDATGRLVKSFKKLNVHAALNLTWNGTDDLNRRLPAGVYFVRLETDKACLTKKAILLR